MIQLIKPVKITWEVTNMKKLAALILTLILAIVSCCAMADTIEVQPGSPSKCSYTDFKTMFDLFTSASNYQFIWDSEKTTEGSYDVYSCTSSDGLLTLKVYVSGGNFSHVLGEGSTVFTADTVDNAKKLGEWFGASLAGVVLTVYAAENGNLNESLATQLQEELQPMVSVLGALSDDAVQNGVATTVNVLGYPCGLAVSGSAVGSVGTLKMKIGITGTDGKIVEVK